MNNIRIDSRPCRSFDRLYGLFINETTMQGKLDAWCKVMAHICQCGCAVVREAEMITEGVKHEISA